MCLNQVDRPHYSVADDKLSKLDDHDAGRFKKDPSEELIVDDFYSAVLLIIIGNEGFVRTESHNKIKIFNDLQYHSIHVFLKSLIQA